MNPETVPLLSNTSRLDKHSSTPTQRPRLDRYIDRCIGLTLCGLPVYVNVLALPLYTTSSCDGHRLPSDPGLSACVPLWASAILYMLSLLLACGDRPVVPLTGGERGVGGVSGCVCADRTHVQAVIDGSRSQEPQKAVAAAATGHKAPCEQRCWRGREEETELHHE